MKKTVVASALALASAAASVAQTPDDAASHLAAARSALACGAQRELVQHVRRLLALTPDDPLALLLAAAAHASLGPEFAKDLALQSLRRLTGLPLEQLPAGTRQQLTALAGVRGPIDKLREQLAVWQREVVRDRPLLIAADKATVTRAAALAARDVDSLRSQQSEARQRLTAARQAVTRCERALTSARTRKFAVGEGMRDLQPLADALATAKNKVAAQERRLREIGDELPQASERAARLKTRLGQYQQ